MTDIQSEIETRKAQRDILAAFLLAHPNRDLWEEDLTVVIGPNYRSRVSECVKELRMDVRNVPRWREYRNKRKQLKRVRLIGGYRYVPDASEPSPDRWSMPGAPLGAEPFHLTSPEGR